MFNQFAVGSESPVDGGFESFTASPCDKELKIIYKISHVTLLCSVSRPVFVYEYHFLLEAMAIHHAMANWMIIFTAAQAGWVRHLVLVSYSVKLYVE